MRKAALSVQVLWENLCANHGNQLSMSHFGMDVWQDLLRQTLEDDSLSHAEKTLGLTHQTAFNMRHKLLMALEDFFGESPVVLGDVTEFDETFVLDSYKGRLIPETAGRPSRRHGAATKYLNRYNALFQIAYRSIESKIALLVEKLFRPGCTVNIHTVKAIATHNLLAVYLSFSVAYFFTVHEHSKDPASSPCLPTLKRGLWERLS